MIMMIIGLLMFHGIEFSVEYEFDLQLNAPKPTILIPKIDGDTMTEIAEFTGKIWEIVEGTGYLYHSKIEIYFGEIEGII